MTTRIVTNRGNGFWPLLVLLLAGCASDPATAPDSGGEGGGADAPAGADSASAGNTAASPAETASSALLYNRINSMTNRWMALGGEPGDAARAERASLESAIGGEVYRSLDEVMAQARGGRNPRFRRAAIRGLGFVAVREKDILEILEGTLEDADLRLVTGALVSLARHAHRDTDTTRVAALLQSPDSVVRSNAALTLSRVFRVRRGVGVTAAGDADEGVLEASLMTALFDPEDPFVRGHAAQALGSLGSDGAEGALLNGLRDTAPFVRLSSAVALGSVGTERAVAPVLATLAGANEDNEANALALTLGRIAERSGRKPPLAELGRDASKWREWFER